MTGIDKFWHRIALLVRIDTTIMLVGAVTLLCLVNWH
jgi:hypothetical protein